MGKYCFFPITSIKYSILIFFILEKGGIPFSNGALLRLA